MAITDISLNDYQINPYNIDCVSVDVSKCRNNILLMTKNIRYNNYGNVVNITIILQQIATKSKILFKFKNEKQCKTLYRQNNDVKSYDESY